MRMEKINDRQVRCVVTSQDLSQRKITPEALRYGSKEASELFREVVSAASARFGFNEEQLPVMIEAVPLNQNELLIIVSAVEDAEEMDPHFARFRTPDEAPDQGDRRPDLNLLTDNVPALRAGVLDFTAIDEVTAFCRRAAGLFSGENLLYRENGLYRLVLIRPEDLPNPDFLKVLNSLSEYGEPAPDSNLLYAYLLEHETPFMTDPIGVLSKADY